ncbi:hypothetical protein B0O80DRAFT_494112 [Mortierella sp. GBAus27b]|nr:hypothetical protein B0O80DRAFT_494112 [Mortierella sp. GBAus27b]
MIAQHERNRRTSGGSTQTIERQEKQELASNQPPSAALGNTTLPPKQSNVGNEGIERSPSQEEHHTDPSHCVICLNSCDDRTVLSTCRHEFCFHCILQWSMISHSCPLCVQIFDSCIHDIKDDQNYTVHRFEPLSGSSCTGSSPASASSSSTIHASTPSRQLTVPYGIIRQLYGPPQNRRRYRNQQRSERAEERLVSEQHQDALERRRHVYHHRLFVKHMGANRISGFQQITPETFKVLPHRLERLIPWIRRDLQAILSLSTSSFQDTNISTTEDHYRELHPTRRRYEELDSGLEVIREYIIAVLKRYDLQTDHAQDLLRDFLHGHTEHFVHELMAFARSPYSLEAYDQSAQYKEIRPGGTLDSTDQEDTSDRGRSRRRTADGRHRTRTSDGDSRIIATSHRRESRSPSSSRSAVTESHHHARSDGRSNGSSSSRSRSRSTSRSRSKSKNRRHSRHNTRPLRHETRSKDILRSWGRSRSNRQARVTPYAAESKRAKLPDDSQRQPPLSRVDMSSPTTGTISKDKHSYTLPTGSSVQGDLASILKTKLQREPFSDAERSLPNRPFVELLKAMTQCLSPNSESRPNFHAILCVPPFSLVPLQRPPSESTEAIPLISRTCLRPRSDLIFGFGKSIESSGRDIVSVQIRFGGGSSSS